MNIKLFFTIICLFQGIFMLGQKPGRSTEKKLDSTVNVVAISAKAIYALPLNSSYVKDGLELKVGGELSYNIYMFDHYLICAGYNWFKGEVIDKQVTGNYDRTNVSVLFFRTGYRLFPVEDLELLFSFGIGTLRYMNRIDDLDAYDSGFSYWVGPQLTYTFVKGIAVTASVDFRRDKLNIQVPRNFDARYNKIYYANLGMGISFVF